LLLKKKAVFFRLSIIRIAFPKRFVTLKHFILWKIKLSGNNLLCLLVSKVIVGLVTLCCNLLKVR